MKLSVAQAHEYVYCVSNPVYSDRVKSLGLLLHKPEYAHISLQTPVSLEF